MKEHNYWSATTATSETGTAKIRQSASFIHPTGTLARHLFFPRQTSGANSLHLRSNFGRLHLCFPESSMARLSVCLVNLHPDNTTVPKIYHGHSSESYCFVNELKHEPEYTLQIKKKNNVPKKEEITWLFATILFLKISFWLIVISSDPNTSRTFVCNQISPSQVKHWITNIKSAIVFRMRHCVLFTWRQQLADILTLISLAKTCLLSIIHGHWEPVVLNRAVIH